MRSGPVSPVRAAGLGWLAALLILTGCTSATDGGPASSTTLPTTRATGQSLRAEVVADGLSHPWDLAELPDGSFLLDERGGRLLRLANGATSEIRAELSDLFAQGETGLMGLVLDPDFADNRRFYTCQGKTAQHDIRVISWRLAPDNASAERVEDPLASGLALNSGRHGGCRLLFDGSGALLISAGDAAQGQNPQSLTRLGGKVLRVNAADGSPAADNPFRTAADPRTRLIYSYGHRNIQGLALRPGTDQLYAAEHGPSIDDEVNLLQAGGNYGWNPVGSGGYNESVPMTDPSIAGAVPAVWSSGDPTVAVSGATFLNGRQWGRYDGRLAVATLRGTHLMLLSLDAAGRVTGVERALENSYGRLRTVRQGSDGALYVLTDNGEDDKVLRVTLGG